MLLPWQARERTRPTGGTRRHGAAAVYLRYLDDRPDSIIAALRLIAHTDGATLVHCAAGKDRTGTVVALALAEVGVPADAIAADYARSAERVAAVFARLAQRPDLRRRRDPRCTPTSSTGTSRGPRRCPARSRRSTRFTAACRSWLRANGWTDADAAALRRHLLG